MTQDLYKTIPKLYQDHKIQIQKHQNPKITTKTKIITKIPEYKIQIYKTKKYKNPNKATKNKNKKPNKNNTKIQQKFKHTNILQ